MTGIKGMSQTPPIVVGSFITKVIYIFFQFEGKFMQHEQHLLLQCSFNLLVTFI